MSLEHTVEQVRQETAFTQKAFAGLEEALLAEMFATNVDQTAKREKLFFALKSLRTVRSALERALTDGAALVNYQVLLAEHGLSSPNP